MVHAQQPRRERLAHLKRDLQALRETIRAFPVGSPERDALADRIGELAGQVIALTEELEG